MGIMRPERGLQELTSRRMLTGDMSLEERFSPDSFRNNALESGGTNQFLDDIREAKQGYYNYKEEKKKKEKGLQSALSGILEKIMRPGSVQTGIAKPSMDWWR